jgi:outer membrane immunogenic protein
MKRSLIVAVAMLAAGSAYAADLPVKAPPVAVPVFTWTGPYIGLNVGYSWGSQTINGNATGTSTTGGVTTALATTPLFGSGSLNGVIGGGQIGYNWQFGNWLVGVEGDFQGSGERKTYTVCMTSGCPVGSEVVTADNRLTWFGTDRVRFGYLPVQRLFLYGTAGLAYGSFTAEAGTPLFVGPLFNNWSSVRAGWTAGAGLEAAIDYDWSFKIEYLYMDISGIAGPTATATTIAGGTTTVRTFSFNQHFTDNIVRIGFNYRFGAPAAAVVAKY